jgi:hypothetical protein
MHPSCVTFLDGSLIGVRDFRETLEKSTYALSWLDWKNFEGDARVLFDKKLRFVYCDNDRILHHCNLLSVDTYDDYLRIFFTMDEGDVFGSRFTDYEMDYIRKREGIMLKDGVKILNRSEILDL